MEEPVELHDIRSHVTNFNVDNESEYEIPTTSRNEETEYTRIGSMAETCRDPGTTRKTSNADKVRRVSRTDTDIAALKKVYIFCVMLLAILVILAVIIGVLTYTLMMRTGSLEAKSDKLETKITKMQSSATGLSDSDPASMELLRMEIQEMRSNLDATKANTDAALLTYSDKIAQLEKDRLLHSSFIQDHASRITQLESKAVKNAEDHLKLDAKVTSLDADNTINLATILKLNNTLEHIILNVSSSEDAIQNYQRRLNELETDLSQSIMELVNISLIKLEVNMSEQMHTIKDIESRIKDIDTNDISNNDSLLMHDARISTLENNITTKLTSEIAEIKANQQDYSSRITQLESHAGENARNNQKIDSRITSLEIEKMANQANILKLNITFERLTVNISSNEGAITNLQRRISVLETDIHVHQNIIAYVNASIAELELNVSETIPAFKNIESTIKKLEAMVILSNDTFQQQDRSITQIKINMTTNHALEMAAIWDMLDRISELESNSNDTKNLYENTDVRLDSLEGGLNCTWGPWSSFSPCTTTCDAGLHYRERTCDSFNPDFSEHWCSRTETDIQTCCYGPCKQGLASDCKDILQKNVNATDGVYSVSLDGTCDSIEVYCDMTTDGGGWTVFQKRFNGTVDFYRGFNEYENGFGSVYNEFWLGLKYIYKMTKDVESELRIDLVKSTGDKGHATYQSFSISGPTNYTLYIRDYSGTAGTSLSIHNNGSHFSTHDRDVDSWSNNCAETFQGGCRYRWCSGANLNGHYATPGTLSPYRGGGGGVIYYSFDQLRSLKSTEMKFRRKD